MLYRTLIPIVVAAVSACAAQNTRPPPVEPTSTTEVTSSALTITPVATVAPPGPMTPAPIAPKYRAVLDRNPDLAGVSLDDVRIEQVGGHVILTGYLPTVADKVAVELSIRKLPDVTSVTNDIRLRR